MMHGEHWSGQDIRGWLATEKLDGCRGYWDGARMWSRSGRAFPIPEHWRERLPKMHLEGEIWAGRQQFPVSTSAVVRNVWAPEVCFLVFDAPKLPGTWADRMRGAARGLRRCVFASPVPWVAIEDVPQMATVFRAIGSGGGEGVMLRCPISVGYQAGRGRRVLKLTRDPIDGRIYPGRLDVERRLRTRRAA